MLRSTTISVYQSGNTTNTAWQNHSAEGVSVQLRPSRRKAIHTVDAPGRGWANRPPSVKLSVGVQCRPLARTAKGPPRRTALSLWRGAGSLSAEIRSENRRHTVAERQYHPAGLDLRRGGGRYLARGPTLRFGFLTTSPTQDQYLKQRFVDLRHNLGPELGWHGLPPPHKTREGSANPDRGAQFRHISKNAAEASADRQPVISVDTKKKEPVGDFKNGGREWRPQGKPDEVRVHDFLIKDLDRVVPYGIYDIASSAGWVSVGINHDTAEFAVQTIRRRWYEIGSVQYADANRLLITADGGGSNGSRVRLWKRELQRLADEIRTDIVVHYLPPRDKQVEQNRTQAVLVHNAELACQTAAELSGPYRSDRRHDNADGLKVVCELDTNTYPKWIVVPDAEMDAIHIVRADFHGGWNYTIKPNPSSNGAVDS